MPPTPDERQLLRARGTAALQAMMGAVTDQLLLYIAPGSLPGQVRALHQILTGVIALTCCWQPVICCEIVPCSLRLAMLIFKLYCARGSL